MVMIGNFSHNYKESIISYELVLLDGEKYERNEGK